MSLLMVELVGIFATAGFFALRYGFSRPWWRTWGGRALLTAALGLTLLAGSFIAQAVTAVPDWFFEIVGAVIWLGALFKVSLLISDDLDRHRGLFYRADALVRRLLRRR